MERSSVSTLQALMVMFGSTGLLNHVIIIPMILKVAGRDSWISVLIGVVVSFIWIPLLYLIMKRTSHHHLFEWIQERWGKTVSFLLSGVVSLYLLFSSVVTLKDMLTWTRASYMPMTPIFPLLFLFVVICFANSFSGIQSISITAGILIPVVVVLGFFVMSGNFHQKDYHQLLPLMEKGWSPVLQGIFYGGAGFVELVYLLLMQHHLRNPMQMRTLFLTSACIAGLTLGPLMASVAEFGAFEAASQRYPAFEEWRLLYIGRYIEHVDFLSIYQWLTGAFIRISLCIYLIPEVFQIRQANKRRWWLVTIYLLMGALVYWPISDMRFLDVLIRWGLPSATLWLLGFSLLVGMLVLIRGKQKAV